MSLILPLLVALVLLAGVTVTVVVAVFVTRALKSEAQKPADPREVLRRRYAAGEISEDEYHWRMSGLSQGW